jgi:sugar (pentulose or hexulose) kinase
MTGSKPPVVTLDIGTSSVRGLLFDAQARAMPRLGTRLPSYHVPVGPDGSAEIQPEMIADALGKPVAVCSEPEASNRGAALWALFSLNRIAGLGARPAAQGRIFSPRREYRARYDELFRNSNGVFLLFMNDSAFFTCTKAHSEGTRGSISE